MVIALFPLWGAIVGGAWALAAVPPWLVVLAWIAVARGEQRVLRLSNAYLLASVVTGAAWLGFPVAWEVAVTGHAVARAAMIALAWVARPAASGLTFAVASWAAMAAIGTAIAVAFVTLDYRRAIVFCAGAYFLVRLVRAWSYRSRGGIDDTALAAAKGLTEAMAVLIGSLL